MAPLPSLSVLSEEECWHLLAGQAVGRLATSVSGEPEIFPVNFTVAGNRVFLRTKRGTKLVDTTISPRVAFEVDDIGEDSAWSVVVKGRAKALRSEAENEEARATGLTSYLEDGKTEWICIAVSEISGRRLVPGAA